MSATPSEHKKNSLAQTHPQPFFPIRKMSNGIEMYSSSNSATRIRGPKPFYRSRITPDPFDYSNETRRQTDYPAYAQRRLSFNQTNDSSSSTKAYESDQEKTRNAYYSPTSRSIVNVRAISISRPESPSMAINHRSITHLPSNIHEKTFHISVGNPSKSRETTSPPLLRQMDFQRDSIDHRLPANVVANRFKPLIAYTIPNRTSSPVLDSKMSRRPPTLIHLPPIASLTTPRLSNPLRNDTDHLKALLMKTIHRSSAGNFFGMCGRCHDEILGEENGLMAMDRMYHVACFTCTMCGGRLRGMHFYSMENQPYCEPCYIHSLEKCVVCAQPITDRVLRATGKAYHAQCFCCVVCRKSLDGVPFTIDIRMDVHCIDCFHQKFAPRCFLCHQLILPAAGQDETIRIVAFDRNYHVNCYRCENCQIQLNNNQQGCYPIDEHIFCSDCYLFYGKTRFTYA